MGALIDALHALADFLTALAPSAEAGLAEIVPLVTALGVAGDPQSGSAVMRSSRSWAGAGHPSVALDASACEESLSAC